MAFWFALLVVLAVVVVAAAVGGWVLVGDITRLVRIAQWTEAGKRKDPGAVVVGVYADPDTNLNHLRDIRVAGVASTTAEAAATLARQFDLPKSYGSFEEMLADPTVHAVYIATSIPKRYELVTQALMANHHVLCQAPLAPNARQIRDTVVLAAQMRRTLVEAMEHRHHPVTERVRDLVQSNTIGYPRRVSVVIRLPWYLAPPANDPRLSYAMAGGAMMHLGIYGVHLLRFILGCDPEVVSAKARLSDADPKVDAAMTAELAFDDFETLADRSVREFKMASSDGKAPTPGAPTSSVRSPSPSASSGGMAGLRTLAQGWLSRASDGAGGGSPGPTSPGAGRRMRSLSSVGGDPSGFKRVTATVECEFIAWQLLPAASIDVQGTEGELHLDNFLLPHLTHKLTVKSKVLGTNVTEHCYGEAGASPSEYQLQAFAEEIKYKVRCCQDRHDATKTMHVVDQIYTAAGLPVRGGATDVPQLLARIEALDPSLLTPPVSRAGDRRGSISAIDGANTPSKASAPFIRSRTRPELSRDLKLRPAPGATVSPPSPSTGTTPPLPVESPVRPLLQRSTSSVVVS